MKRLSLYLALLLHGWRPCRMSDGSKGWRKQCSHRIVRKGHIRYAVQNLLAD